jgi:hypothetical protein
MASPFRHPKTGIYWLRKRVPKDLVPVLGKAEVSRSLETRDPGEAKKRLLTVLSDLCAALELLEAWDEAPARKQELIHAALVHLFMRDVLRLRA